MREEVSDRDSARRKWVLNRAIDGVAALAIGLIAIAGLLFGVPTPGAVTVHIVDGSMPGVFAGFGLSIAAVLCLVGVGFLFGAWSYTKPRARPYEDPEA